MGMNSEDFWDMTPREFHFKMEGHFEREMLKERLNWERTRWAACWMVNVHGDGKKTIQPRELVEFDWEKEERAARKPITQEELIRAKELYDGDKFSG